MRTELFYRPSLALERIALALHRRRRRQRLRGTPAASLGLGEIDSLELLEIARAGSPSVIYDIGANVGTWSLLAKSILPRACIHAFEPLAAPQAAFKARCGTFADIHLHGVALGATAATLELNVLDFPDASSFLAPRPEMLAEFGIKPTERRAVPVFPLDAYRSTHALPPPDLLKLDVQGYELAVLEGATDCLAQARYVLSEVSFREYYAGQPLFHDLAAFLARHGFRLHAFSEPTPVGREIGQTDALFMKS